MAKLRPDVSLDYCDVAIYQKKNPVASRLETDISSEIIKGVRVSIPIIAANMSSVVNVEFYKAMVELGAFAVLHRGHSNQKRLEEVKALVHSNVKWIATSIGTGPAEQAFALELIKAGANILVIDIAHGYSDSVISLCRYLKAVSPHIKIVVGNTMNPGLIEELHDCVDAIKVGIGPGCLAAGTRILLSNGRYKNIEDLTLKDRVINKDGKPVRVVAVKNSGVKRVVKFKNSAFYKPTLVTSEHGYFVGNLDSISDPCKTGSIAKQLSKSTKNGQSKLQWRPIQDTEKSVLLFPRNIEFDIPSSFSVDTSEYFFARRNMYGNIEAPIITPSYDLGYIFGTFLGDGNAKYSTSYRKGTGNRNSSGVLSWYFGLAEQEIAEKLQKAIKNTFKVDAKIQKTSNMVKVLVHNNWIVRLFLEFGKRKSKNLPEKFYCLNPEYLLGIKDGLVDSDGTYRPEGGVSLSNTSPELIELFSIINLELHGILPSTHAKSPSAGRLKNCNVDNCSPSFVSKTLLNPHVRVVQDKYIYSRITKFEFTEEFVETYDIEVDCPTHSFVADNAVVHNSACITKNTAGSTSGMISTIMECYEVASKYCIPLIADGGIREPADFSKAICAGASSVMIGSLLARTNESASPKVVEDGVQYCLYYGMASKRAQDEWKGGVKEGTCVEGTTRKFQSVGAVKDLVDMYAGALRSGLTYAGGRTILEAHEVTEFVRFK